RADALAGKAVTLTPGGGLGGTPTLTETHTDDGALAISGATQGNLGVAGSLAINLSTTSTGALLTDGATVNAPASTALVTATNTTESIGSGTASAKANSVGVGASFSINVVKNDTRAEMQSG